MFHTIEKKDIMCTFVNIFVSNGWMVIFLLPKNVFSEILGSPSFKYFLVLCFFLAFFRYFVKFIDSYQYNFLSALRDHENQYFSNVSRSLDNFVYFIFKFLL